MINKVIVGLCIRHKLNKVIQGSQDWGIFSSSHEVVVHSGEVDGQGLILWPKIIENNMMRVKG